MRCACLRARTLLLATMHVHWFQPHMLCSDLTTKKTRRLLAADLGLSEKGLDGYKHEIGEMLDRVCACICALVLFYCSQHVAPVRLPVCAGAGFAAAHARSCAC